MRKIGDIDYLTAEELAVALSLGRTTVIRLARKRLIPYYAVGRRWLYRLDEVMAALRRAPFTPAAATTDERS